MKTLFKFTLLVFLTVTAFGCNNKKLSKTVTQFGEINVITPGDFKEKSQGQTVIDIRTPKEFAEGHLEGAVNIDYFDNSFLEQISKLDKNQPIFLYCRSGSRSSSARKKIANKGFVEVNDLQGGIMNWAKNNQQIIK